MELVGFGDDCLSRLRRSVPFDPVYLKDTDGAEDKLVVCRPLFCLNLSFEALEPLAADSRCRNIEKVQEGLGSIMGKNNTRLLPSASQITALIDSLGPLVLLWNNMRNQN